VRTREDVRVAAQSDHDLADPPARSWSQPEPGPANVASSHEVRSRRPVMPHSETACQ
jgi:hypothetical protein